MYSMLHSTNKNNGKASSTKTINKNKKYPPNTRKSQGKDQPLSLIDFKTETTRSLNKHITSLVASASMSPVHNNSTQQLTPIEAAQRATQILSQMETNYNNDPQKYARIKPDTISYTATINAWAKSGAWDAPQRAERILERMEEYVENQTVGYEHIRPNVITYSAVINAWAKCSGGGKNSKHSAGDNSAPYQAEKILAKLESLYQTCLQKQNGGVHDDKSSGNQKTENSYNTDNNDGSEPSCQMLKPNARCYNSVIDAWSRNASPTPKGVGAAKRAASALSRLEERYANTGDMEIQPDTFSYTCVVNAYSRLNSKEGAEMAMELVDKMEGIYDNDPFGRVKPNVFTYSSLVNAYANAGMGIQGAEQAEKILERMVKNRGVGPNVFVYQGVIEVSFGFHLAICFVGE